MGPGKVTLLIIFILAGVLLAAGSYFSSVYNARIAGELKNNPTGQRAALVMLITFPDGRSTPVNYLREGDTVFAGSDFNWWKRISSDGTRLELLIKGEKLEGVATVSNDTNYTYEVFERLRPDAPVWASRLIGAKLVVIQLDSEQQPDQN